MNKAEQIQETLELPLNEAYTRFRLFMVDYPTLAKYHDKIRYGIDIDFDLLIYFDDMKQEKNSIFHKRPRSDLITIWGKTYRFSDFIHELEERKVLLQHALTTEITEEDGLRGHGA